MRAVRRLIPPLVLVALALALAAPALAHPLGNFTVNEYAGLRVRPSEILVDAVLDRAEIPTFEVRRRLDDDGDGAVSAEEADRAVQPECDRFGSGMVLAVGGARTPLRLTAGGLSFPPGSGGLATSRLVCQFTVLITLRAEPTHIAFSHRASVRQPGWREIVVEGDGVTVEGDGLAGTSVSRRLTAYPAERLADPLTMDAVELLATAGGPSLAPSNPPDARPLPDSRTGDRDEAGAVGADRTIAPVTEPVTARGEPLPEIFRTELSPAVAILAVVAALLLGAGHALTPGHGKTVIAAWLVGSRATPGQAVQLGLAVAVAHTLGILLLAVLALAGERALPPGTVALWAPVLAGAIVVAIGTWMLARELERRGLPGARQARARGHEHEHGHGADAARVSHRGLLGLGLAGGLVPSASALVILLGAIAAGRVAFGLVLVVAFGAGMAVVMTLLGILLVRGRDRLTTLWTGGPRRVLASLPLLAACVVVGMGAWLTGQALAAILAA